MDAVGAGAAGEVCRRGPGKAEAARSRALALGLRH